MTTLKEDDRPAVEEYAGQIADLFTEARTSERPQRDRRLEAADWAIKESAEGVRTYLEALERWELAYNVQLAVGTLRRKDSLAPDPPYVQNELSVAAELQKAAREAVSELEPAATPGLDRLIRLLRIREDLQERLKDNSEGRPH